MNHSKATHVWLGLFQALLACFPLAGIINTPANLPLNMKLSSAVKKIQLMGQESAYCKCSLVSLRVQSTACINAIDSCTQHTTPSCC